MALPRPLVAATALAAAAALFLLLLPLLLPLLPLLPRHDNDLLLLLLPPLLLPLLPPPLQLPALRVALLPVLLPPLPLLQTTSCNPQPQRQPHTPQQHPPPQQHHQQHPQHPQQHGADCALLPLLLMLLLCQDLRLPLLLLCQVPLLQHFRASTTSDLASGWGAIAALRGSQVKTILMIAAIYCQPVKF